MNFVALPVRRPPRTKKATSIPLHRACLAGNPKKVLRALSAEPESIHRFARCPEGGIDLYKQPIHIAAMMGHTRCLRVLLERKAAIGHTRATNPLEYAVSGGHISCMSLLHRQNSSFLPSTAVYAGVLHACLQNLLGVVCWLTKKYPCQLKQHSAQILLTLGKQGKVLGPPFVHLLYRLNPVSACQIAEQYVNTWPSLSYLHSICNFGPLHLAVREGRFLNVVHLLRVGHDPEERVVSGPTITSPEILASRNPAIVSVIRDARSRWSPRVAYCWPHAAMRRARLLLLIAQRRRLRLPTDILVHIQSFWTKTSSP